MRRRRWEIGLGCVLVVGCASGTSGAPPPAAPSGSSAAAEPGPVAAPAEPGPAAPPEPSPEPLACPPEAAAAEALEPIRLARPPFVHHVAEPYPVEPEAPPRLRLRSSRRNRITDTDAWLSEHGLAPPTLAFADEDPASLEARGVPLAIEGAAGSRVLVHPDHRVYLYDTPEQRGRYLLVVTSAGERFGPYDFASYRDAETASAFTAMGTEWAMRVGELLLVTHAHATYAEASGGHNAYLTALSLHGPLYWRSDPLVANARQCVVRGSHAICGYGFTSEPDFLYVLDLRDGRTVDRTPVRSGPDLLYLEGDQLLVRTYDTNYVFDVR